MMSGKRFDSSCALSIAAGLVSLCWFSASVADDVADRPVEADSAARENWRAVMAHNPASAEGCFQATYPEFTWVATKCMVALPRARPAPVHSDFSGGGGDVTGNGHDYAAQATGLITSAFGTFPNVSGVKTEKSVGVALFGGGGILGPDEYTLQLNTNPTGTTSVCAGHTGCTVWQQFIYATDYATDGVAAVFMQYWLLGWGNAACPKSFASDDGGDCYKNSALEAAPDMPITALAKLTISSSAVAGGNDTVVFNNGSNAYSITGKDSVLDISAVWKQTEFNIVGNAGGSRAKFNAGSTVAVKLALQDGSSAAPKCVKNAGSTGESNNLTLGACTTAGGTTPSIQFTESD